MRQRVERLALFDGVSEQQLDVLAAAASERDAPAGAVLVERDHPASGMFVLEEGRAVVELGERQVELGPGDVFGEIALVGLRGARTARVRALTEARCLCFARADVERVLDEEPELRARLRALAESRLER